jgi:hypothetical protein
VGEIEGVVGVGEIEGMVGVEEPSPVHDDTIRAGESLPVHDDTFRAGESSPLHDTVGVGEMFLVHDDTIRVGEWTLLVNVRLSTKVVDGRGESEPFVVSGQGGKSQSCSCD